MVLYVLELSNSDIYLSLFILYSEIFLKEYFLDEFIIRKWQVYAWEPANKLLILCSLPNGMFCHLCLFVSLCLWFHRVICPSHRPSKLGWSLTSTHSSACTHWSLHFALYIVLFIGNILNIC